MSRHIIVLAIVFSAFSNTAWAKRVVVQGDEVKGVQDEPATGRDEATKYFKNGRRPAEVSVSSGARDHYLALHLGGFVNSEGYVWGVTDKAEDIGKLNIGLTYRMGEWVNSADSLLKVDFISYEVDDSKPLKMSVLLAAAFPDANSMFPLYFGAGIGPGIFFKQARTESPLSLDYSLFGGARWFDAWESVGFFFEAGLKNHFHLLSDGQFNGVFFALGALFTF